jgi:rhodanese-related sulfurtransferase
LNTRRFAAEISAIVVCAALCATISNLVAGRERKLAVVGHYPNSLTLPQLGALAVVPSPGAIPAPQPTAAPVPPSADRPSPPAATPVRRPASPAPPPSSPPPAAPKAGGAAASVASSGALRSELLSRFPPHPDRPFADISGADALWAHGRGVPFLDARRTKVYEEGHVAGARSFSVWESDVDQKVFAFQEEVGKDLPVVLYCSGGECEDSHMLADKLFGAGFANVLVYKDGWPDWVKRGGPVRTGPTP